MSVTNKRPKAPSPGDYDPSVPILVAEDIASSSRYADSATRARLGRAISDFTMRSQAMSADGSGQTWWTSVPASANEMTYECSPDLGSPAPADCAHVEWSELGPDDETISLAEGAVKFLSSSRSSPLRPSTTLLLMRRLRYLPSRNKCRNCYHH